jgi:hypothetical protein
VAARACDPFELPFQFLDRQLTAVAIRERNGRLVSPGEITRMVRDRPASTTESRCANWSRVSSSEAYAADNRFVEAEQARESGVMDRFADRLDPETYATEEPVALGLASEGVEGWLYVPSTVFARLLAIGRGYGLHLLGQVLRYEEETRLNHLQCAELLDELAFVLELVSDPVLDAWLPLVEQRVTACSRSTRAEETLVLDLSQ